MNIIEDYLKIIYEDDNSKEVQELKEELKEHLITSTNEFIQQGYEIDEAQNKAIDQFDGGNEASLELRSIYTKKIDMKKEKLEKIYGIRWKLINIFGWLLSASIFTACFTIDDIVPTWLIALVLILAIILIILKVVIFILRKIIEKD